MARGCYYTFSTRSRHEDDRGLKFRFDWGDGDTSDWTGYVPSDSTVQKSHAWREVGQYEVLAQAGDVDDRVSDWSEPCAVEVPYFMLDAPGAPAGPETTLVGIELTEYRVTASPATNRLIRYIIDWGECSFCSTDTSKPMAPGDTALFYRLWSYVGKHNVRACVFFDSAPWERSDWSRPTEVWVFRPHIPVWWWVTPDQDSVPPNCSPLVAVSINDGREYVYVGADDELGRFYRIDPRKGRTSGSRNGMVPEEVFTGHPAFCDATKHIIVGNQEGELHAFDTELGRDWHYPGNSNEQTVDHREWGTPAINGSYIYVARDDTAHGTFASLLYRLQDQGSQAGDERQYGFTKTILDAPVIDNTGNVLLGTDAGTLVKMPPDISSITWEIVLDSAHDVHAPAIGSNGTIYCGSTGGKLWAVAPDSALLWMESLEGEVFQPVISADAVYANTSAGKLYSYTLAGSRNWEKQISSELRGTPVLAGADFIYCRSGRDSLYCVDRASGDVLWSCDCSIGTRAGPSRPRVRRPEPSLATLSGGYVLIVTSRALLCVACDSRNPLATAPWPKWQHDGHNTGKSGNW